MSSYTVLCVDTAATIEDLSTAVDTNESLRPLVETTVEGAIETLEAKSVDCVVTGSELADGSGLEVIETAKSRTARTPCVLVTSVEPARVDTSEFDSGAVEYLNREAPGAFDRLGFVVEDVITHDAQAGYLAPPTEKSRLEALAEYDVDELPVVESFERLTSLITSHFDIEVAFIGLVDRNTEEFVACTGAEWDYLLREETVCTHSMLHEEVMVVEDISADRRFRDNTTLQQLGIVSYAGANMTTPDGQTIGQVCAIGHEPRAYSDAERADLQRFADTAMEILELRQTVHESQQLSDTE